MDKKTRPTKDLIETASNVQLCWMVVNYRDTPYHDTFLRLLFDVPLEIWSDSDWKAEEILPLLQPKEREKLLKMYFATRNHSQNPLIVLILLEQKKTNN